MDAHAHSTHKTHTHTRRHTRHTTTHNTHRQHTTNTHTHIQHTQRIHAHTTLVGPLLGHVHTCVAFPAVAGSSGTVIEVEIVAPVPCSFAPATFAPTVRRFSSDADLTRHVWWLGAFSRQICLEGGLARGRMNSVDFRACGLLFD